MSPAPVPARPRKPFILGVGEEHLAVLGRAQDVDAEPRGRCGDKGAAVGVPAGQRFTASVGIAGLPIDMLAGDPVIFDVEAIQELRKSQRLWG